MAFCITLNSFKYVLKRDRKDGVSKEEKTVFTLRRLSARENAQIEDGVSASLKTADVTTGNPDARIGVESSPGTTTVDTLRIGLRGWYNFHNPESGGKVEFVAPDKDGPWANLCPFKNLDYLDPDARHELAEIIGEGNNMTEEDSKNLPLEPTS